MNSKNPKPPLPGPPLPRRRGGLCWRGLARAPGMIFIVLAAANGPAAPGTNQPPAKTTEPAARLVKASGRIDQYYPAPHETQIKTRVESSGSSGVQGGGAMLMKDVKVQTWLVTGQPEIILETPECTFDQKANVFSSPGPLKIRTGDGRLSIEGEGFTFYQTNSVLFISNQVHTAVHSPPPTPSTATAPKLAGPAVGSVQVFSDRFQFFYETGSGIYEGHVRVTGTNLSMSCGNAHVSVPTEHEATNAPTDQRTLQSITATDAVVIDYEMEDQNIRKIHVTGERAIYQAGNEITTITGHPTWQADQRDGHGDELVLDATNKTFRVTGNAFLKIPAQALGENSFLPAAAAQSRPGSSSTIGFVEVNCDHYLLQTNFASFGGSVQVTRLTEGKQAGMMTCSNLNLYFGGTNQVQQMIAERNVVIEQTTNSFKADRAVYTGTNHLLEFTGNPSWRSGEREGKGELVEVNLQDEQMTVVTNAFLRLPAGQLGESFAPAGPTTSTAKSIASRTGRTNAVASVTKTAAEKKNAAGPQFADITCDRYVLNTNSARFNGHVRVDHPQMDWVCDSLRLASSGEAAKETRLLVAERGVDFHITNEQGQSVHGTCEKSVYDYRIVDGKTNSVMTLTGSPVLETDEGTITNKIILLDLVAHTIRAPGKYRLSGQAPAVDTNALIRLHQPAPSRKRK